MISSEVCPNCGSKDVRYGSTLAKRCLRWLKGSHKRYCGKCSRRWSVPREEKPPEGATRE
jgi:transposase-like protein